MLCLFHTWNTSVGDSTYLMQQSMSDEIVISTRRQLVHTNLRPQHLRTHASASMNLNSICAVWLLFLFLVIVVPESIVRAQRYHARSARRALLSAVTLRCICRGADNIIGALEFDRDDHACVI